MSANKNVSVNGGWSIPWLIIGVILWFGTSKENTWGGIHTHTVGGWLIVISLALFAFVLLMMLFVLVCIALAGGSTKRRW